MIPLRLLELADVVGGSLAHDDDADVVVDRVTIDSRTTGPGALFVPLRGERADGHDFVADASARGGAGYLWEEGRPLPHVPGAVLVDDPADALLGLGAWMRDAVAPTVVAVTGSNGKTTTKDLIAAAVGAQRVVVANTGSYNNELGVPLTCCRLERETEVLVSEIGARGFGHIAMLAGLVRPDVAVVTTVGPAHLELLGSLEGVARAKVELVESLDGPDSVAVLNADDRRVAAMVSSAPGRVLTYGRESAADWTAEDVRLDEQARACFVAVRSGVRVPVRLAVPGVHNVSNALAALAVAEACGVGVEAAAEALSSAELSRWRMELVESDKGVLVLNDAYNANPQSMAAALDTVAGMPARRRVAVLGLMGEQGSTSASSHEDIGRRCHGLGIDELVVVGEDPGIAAGARAAGFAGALHTVDVPAAAADLLAGRLTAGDVVLVKASRSVGLERVAAALLGPATTEGRE